MNRRTFLKAAGMGGLAFAAGCTPQQDKNLFSLVKAPEDMITGKATWYAGTCRECPAGCGVIAKNREGRLIKLEGNPHHPINRGKLCIRGQAALQAIYDPDRIMAPMVKKRGSWETLSYKEATQLLKKKCRRAATKGPDRIRMLSEITGESLFSLMTLALTQWKSPPPVIHEPLACESLLFAHSHIFGSPSLPAFHMEKADFILSFGADFLETWLSPVEYARKFKAMHGVTNHRKGTFIHLAPHMSLTGANADLFIPCRPTGEATAALGIIRALLQAGSGGALPEKIRAPLAEITRPHTPEKVSQETGVTPEQINLIAEKLLSSKAPLVLGSPATPCGDASALTDMAVTFINLILEPALPLYDFNQRYRIEKADRRKKVLAFFRELKHPQAEILLLHNTNPAFTLPTDAGVQQALEAPHLFTVCFTNTMDETAALADMIFPIQLPLETWDTYESSHTLLSTLQPAMGKLTEAPAMGDLLLALAFDSPPAKTYKDYLIRHLFHKPPSRVRIQWLETIQKGGKVLDTPPVPAPTPMADSLKTFRQLVRANKRPPENGVLFMTAPSIRFFDGRGANRSWLSEIPDPITQVTWQTPLLIHPALMDKKGWSTGDNIRLTTNAGTLTAPAYPFEGVNPDTIVMHLGQGHTHLGRYARNRGSNPLDLLTHALAPISGCPSFAAPVTQSGKEGSPIRLAHTDGSRYQYHRTIALTTSLEKSASPPHKKEGLDMAHFPLTLPIPEGYDKKRDFYPPHDHDTYRWGMAVDLDRCIGCGACVAACYAENNIGVVGEERIAEGREMSWLRIERYQNPKDPNRLTFLPMMCQHCDNAPCESVCPVYAPHHSGEGINNQIYNRCIGTRFCAQNCPYKVRRFNWFDWPWPSPLNLQLNPNVTVRSKGVMEKCSFCIQRIKVAHTNAKNQNRKILDGEILPACVQTCPTSALTFGSFMDKNSRLTQLANSPRAYQALGYLNTKPAVIYLKKVIQKTGAELKRAQRA